MNNTLFSFLIFSACNLLSTSTAIPFNSHQPDFQLINDKSTFDSGPSPPSSVGADFGDPYANSLSNSWLAEEMSGPNAASSHITQQDFMIVPPPPAWQGTDSVVARPGCGSLQPYCCTGRYDSKWNHALQPCWTCTVPELSFIRLPFGDFWMHEVS